MTGKRSQPFLVIVSLVVVLSMLVGCGATAVPTAAPTKAPASTTAPTVASGTMIPMPTAKPAATAVPATPTKAAATPKKGGTLTIAGHQEIAGMGPQDEGLTCQRAVLTQIHNALLEMDENYTLQPVLAESYTAAPDGLSYTFKLRKGVKFSDGKDFTSKDVKYTYDFYRDPANATAIIGKFVGVTSIDTPDDLTVVINLKSVNATALANAPTVFIVQSEYHAKVGEKVYRTAPIGTGAFKLKEWKPSESTLLEAWDGHFRGRANVDFLKYVDIPENSVRMIALQTGTVDMTVWPPLIDDNLKLEKDPKFKVYRYPAVGMNRFPLNNSVPALSDKIVRQAMLYAIDRQTIINDIFKGAGTVADEYLSPALPYQKEVIKKYPYDPAKAIAQLEEAGYKVGSDGIRAKGTVKLSFTCTIITGDQARKPEAEYVQQYLKKVGIEMKLAEAPLATIVEGLRKGTIDASLFQWNINADNGDPDPYNGLGCDSGNNFMKYCNPKMEELIKAGVATVDPAKRKVIYDQVHDLFVDEVPVLYMMYLQMFFISNTKVQGLPEKFMVGDFLWRQAYKWWVAS
jgi:peptide/nickel transport system substrate-binding protein